MPVGPDPVPGPHDQRQTAHEERKVYAMIARIYEITVYTGSEDDGTLAAVHSEHIALRDPDHLKKIATDIMSKYDGDEVTCTRLMACRVID